MEQKKEIKVIIIVLACLLGLSLLALGGTLIYNKIANTTPATVTVPDNLITADEDTTKPDSMVLCQYFGHSFCVNPSMLAAA